MMIRILFAVALLGIASSARAADSTVLNMTAASAISGTDLFYCSQASGTNDRKCTASQLGAWALGATNVVAVSGGGTANFIRADGTWAAGGGTPGGTSGQVQFNNSGSFGGFTVGGDATLNTGTGSLTVTKTNGTSFGPLATVTTAGAAYINAAATLASLSLVGGL